MFRLLDNTQSVNFSPYCWHFYERFEKGTSRAWNWPSRNISIALFGMYIIYFFNLIFIIIHSFTSSNFLLQLNTIPLIFWTLYFLNRQIVIADK